MRKFTLFILSGFIFLNGAEFLQADSMGDAMSLYKEGKYAEAAQAFESLLIGGASRSQRREIYLYMGKSYESSGRLDKALSSYEDAVLYDKKNWRRHRDLGGIYEQSNLYLKALGCYQQALKLNPQEPALFLALGRAWRKIGIIANAMPWLEKALASGKMSPQVEEELSYAYEKQGQFAQATQFQSKLEGGGARLVYLAALAGDDSMIKDGLSRMTASGAPKETIQAYENLVELLRLPSKEILAGKTPNPTLQEILKSPFTEGTK